MADKGCNNLDKVKNEKNAETTEQSKQEWKRDSIK